MYYEGLGRRKTSTARVRLHTDGTGQIVVNGKPYQEYFGRDVDWRSVVGPLEATQTEGRFDVTVLVHGGGITGQAGAVQVGMARALLEVNPDFRPVLRQGGLLTRDARAKERKKPGLRRARKAPQYTKR
ncbi:MAG: 30S ribosomal protein S9 [Anaerolineae bacterium]|jgi:small subunit ribosomal protein S9|nr:30S ribosomal protein S9 [Anaerolineae bacterium]